MRATAILVQNRFRHLAEELERRDVARAECLRRLRRIGLHEAGIAVRQVHRKEMNLLLHPANHRPGLAEVRLRMARLVPQRHEYLALSLATIVNVVLHDRHPAAIAILVAQPLEDPLRCMKLLRMARPVSFQDLIDDRGKRIQLWSLRRSAPPISRRHRKHHHLCYRPRINSKSPRRLAPAQTFDLNRMANPSI
jgi:hypothetical protein